MIQKGQACREEAKSKEKSSAISGSKRKGKTESDKVSKAEVKREMGKKQKVDSSKGYYSLQGRCLPINLVRVIGKLSRKQKKAVTYMGFGKLLSLKTTKIPSKLAYYVVDNFKPENMEIKCINGSVKVDSEAIHLLLGLPNKGLDLVAEKKKSEWTKLGQAWRQRYNKKLMNVKEISRSIISLGEENGAMFKLDFLALFMNTMVECHKNTKCKIGMMDHITDEKDIANIDWCGYIVSKIKRSKENWKSGVLDDQFSGALTILTLLYVDGTYINGINEQRTNSPLVFWTDVNLELRQELELKNGGFGLGDMRLFYVQSDEDSDCSDTKDGDSDYSVDILEAPGVESDLKKIKTIFQWVMGQKKRVEKLALKAYKSYPGNAEVEEVIQKFNECFKTGINLSEMEAEKENDEMSIPFANGSSRTPPVSKRMMPIQTDTGLMMVVYDGEPFDDDEGLTQVSCKVSDWAEQVCKSKSNLKLNNVSKLKEIPAPSFSIGLTQIENEEQNNREVEAERAKNKRKTKLSVRNKSPYIDRAVNIEKQPSKLELKVWCYLMKDTEDQNLDDSEATEEQREVQKEFRDDVFETKNGYITKRFLLRSLEPYEHVLNNVVDCWAIVLNNDETKRAPDSPYRLFMTTSVISNLMLMNNKLKASDRLALFRENLKSVVFVDNIDKEMLTVDIVMFPILEKDHYYLVCFDLKEGTIEIVDNMEKSNVGLADSRSFIKKDTPVKVNEIFLMYLNHVGHKGCQGIRLAKPVIKKLQWSTKSNFVDCGVFCMRHMETYMGSKVKKWRCGLDDDGPKQEVQINNLRLKYAYKILTSNVNIHKNSVVDVAKVLDVDAEYS